MPYTAEISRNNPSSLLFLIDQSGSMQDMMLSSISQALDRPLAPGERASAPLAKGRTKAEAVADVINRLLQNLVIKCAKSEGVRDYYHVGVIGYGAHVRPAFSGPIAGRDLIPISEIAASPARIEERTKKVEDGMGGLVDQTVRFPIWFEPVANDGTPMCQALNRAQSILSKWLADHPDCFPPIVVNITDGESTDGDPLGPATALKQLASSDGNVLLFNIHISGQQGRPIEFPDGEAELPDQYARLLFQMSSPLPEYIRAFAQQESYPVSDATRGFTFNGDMVALIRFLDIGTRPSNLR